MANTGLLKTYDPKQIIITFGSILMTDFAEDTFLEVTIEDAFEEQRGADGSENRTNKNITGRDATLTLSQSSITNDALTAVHTLDKATNQGKQPFTVKDLNGTTLLFSAQAYIKKSPDQSFGASMGDRAWVFRLPQTVENVGSNF